MNTSITSMYPHAMSADEYQYHFDVLYLSKNCFGLIKCKVHAPRDLYFPVLPECSSDKSKVLFQLNVIVRNWASVELQRAV